MTSIAQRRQQLPIPRVPSARSKAVTDDRSSNNSTPGSDSSANVVHAGLDPELTHHTHGNDSDFTHTSTHVEQSIHAHLTDTHANLPAVPNDAKLSSHIASSEPVHTFANPSSSTANSTPSHVNTIPSTEADTPSLLVKPSRPSMPPRRSITNPTPLAVTSNPNSANETPSVATAVPESVVPASIQGATKDAVTDNSVVSSGSTVPVKSMCNLSPTSSSARSPLSSASQSPTLPHRSIQGIQNDRLVVDSLTQPAKTALGNLECSFFVLLLLAM